MTVALRPLVALAAAGYRSDAGLLDELDRLDVDELLELLVGSLWLLEDDIDDDERLDSLLVLLTDWLDVETLLELDDELCSVGP